MPKKEATKRVDITLGQQLLESFQESLVRRRFSKRIRSSIKKFISAFTKSPQLITRKFKPYLTESELRKGARFPKRVTVALTLEDLAGLDKAIQYFKEQGILSSRLQLIRFILTEWPNPE